MVWNITDNNGKVTVTLVKNGEEFSKEFEGTMAIKDAVVCVAKEHGIKNFKVEDASEREISDSQGSQTLASVGNLTVLPETVGAEEEKEEAKPKADEKKEEKPAEEEAKKSEDGE